LTHKQAKKTGTDFQNVDFKIFGEFFLAVELSSLCSLFSLELIVVTALACKCCSVFGKL